MAQKTKEAFLRVRCTKGFKRRVKSLATKRDTNSSDLTRRALTEWLETQETVESGRVGA